MNLQDKDREDFEAAMKEMYGSNCPVEPYDKKHGLYFFGPDQSRWEGWQAAKEHERKHGDITAKEKFVVIQSLLPALAQNGVKVSGNARDGWRVQIDRQQSGHPIDKGPWRAGVTSDAKRHFVQSEDFTHDVRLYVDGDFGSDEDKAAYARGIAQVLSAAVQPAKHPDDAAVDAFAAQMKAKLAKKRHEGRGGWQKCDATYLSNLLHEHVAKGDPVDVANLAMMLHQNGQQIDQAGMPSDEAIEALAKQYDCHTAPGFKGFAQALLTNYGRPQK